MQGEFFRHPSLDELKNGLQAREKIVYRDNGNRAVKGTKFLKKIEKLLPSLGITRVGEISHLAPQSFPVFQSTRPRIYLHSNVGQNSGAQGKGNSKTQAKISCIMETIETFCAEPREAEFIRGSYNFLSKQHCILDPRKMLSHQNRGPTLNEPLLWSWAYSIEQDVSVLVPAESVYCYVLPETYQSRPLFPASTNGLAAGATYLEAFLHAAYELIERMYFGLAQEGKAEITVLDEKEIRCYEFEKFRKKTKQDLNLKLISVKIPGIENLPVVASVLSEDQVYCLGWGCSSSINTSILRAMSESMQHYAMLISGSRDDLLQKSEKKRTAPLRELSTKIINVRKSGRFSKTTRNKDYRSLDEEYSDLIKWIHQLGYKNILVSNLSRHPLGIPVVRVIIPGMPTRKDVSLASTEGWCDLDILKTRYSF